MKRIGTLIGTSALLLLIAGPAWAHVTVSPEEAAPDSFATLNFQVPHGCDGSATVSLSVQIPAGVVSVKPQVKPGWEITIEEGTLPEPVDYFGETLTEGVLSVTWTGGPLEDHYMDMFGMSVKLPNTEGPVFFPAIQTCEQGETAWIQIPAEGQTEEDLEEPAPSMVLEVGAGGHAHEEEAAAAEDEAGATEDETAAAEDTPTDPLVIAALVVGGLGLIAGGTALVVSRRKG
jgi:uncharacterized protein YcnI